jgi:hypothetical protein
MWLADFFQELWPDVINTGRAFRKIALLLCAKWHSLNNMMRVTVLVETSPGCYFIFSTKA